MRPTVGLEQYLQDVDELVARVNNVFRALGVAPSGDLGDLLAKLETTRIEDLDPEMAKCWEDYNQLVRDNNQLRHTLDEVAEALARQKDHDVREQAMKDNS